LRRAINNKLDNPQFNQSNPTQKQKR